jgi:hypothetical protein
MGRSCNTNDGERNANRILVGKPLGRWENNIEMDLREMGWGDIDWISLVRERDQWRALMDTIMNFRVP